MSDISLVNSCPDNKVIFLIDTSHYMYYSLRAVKKLVVDALYDLIDKPGAYFNVIAFNTKLTAWADRCVPCIPENVAAAAYWVTKLKDVSKMECSHLDAIFTALDDKMCDALYLFSNSRPVQKVENATRNSVEAARGRPINCVYPATYTTNEVETAFMRDLALKSGGCFFIANIDEFGNLVKTSFIFQAERRQREPLPFYCKSFSTTANNYHGKNDWYKQLYKECQYVNNDEDYKVVNSASYANYDGETLRTRVSNCDKKLNRVTREQLFSQSTHIPPRNVWTARPEPWKI